MPKYRFRKMYFICENKQVIKDNVLMTNAYRKRETAEQVCKDQDAYNSREKLWMKDKPEIVRSVEGFYLVPEALYEEVLRRFVEGY